MSVVTAPTIAGPAPPNWFGIWQVLAAFNNSLFDDLTAITTVASPPGTLGAKNVWTDITKYVRNLHCHRGRQHETDRFAAGTCDLTLWNTDGRFSPWNTAGPYNNLVFPATPLRVQCTINGTTYPVFTGYFDTVSSVWHNEVSDVVALTCTDALQPFTNMYMATAAYRNQVTTDGASHLWLLNEPSGSTVAADSAGSSPGTYQGTWAPGNPPILTAPSSSANLMPSGSAPLGWIILPPDSSSPFHTFSIEAWVNSPSWADASGGNYIMAWQTSVLSGGTTTLYNTHLSISPSTGDFGLQISDTSGNYKSTFTTSGLSTGVWHHVVATVDSSGNITLYVDGAAAASSTTTAGTLTGAFTPQYEMIGASPQNMPPFASFAGSIANVAFYPSTLSAATVSNHHKLGTKCVAQELSGARVGEALDVLGWPANCRNIDAGNSNMQATTSSLTGTGGLSYLQLVELSENGALFIDRSGNVRFISRRNLLVSPYNTSQQTFGDGGIPEIPFEPQPEIAVDTIDLYTTAIVQRVGGIIQTYENATAAGTYGPRTYQPNQLLVTTDLEALEYAQWEVGRLSTPTPRVRSIMVHPLTDAPGGTASVAVLSREIMDQVTVNRHNLDGNGSMFSQAAAIEGIDHRVDFAAGDWEVTFALNPVDSTAYWVWGSAIWPRTGVIYKRGTSLTTWAY